MAITIKPMAVIIGGIILLTMPKYSMTPLINISIKINIFFIVLSFMGIIYLICKNIKKPYKTLDKINRLSYRPLTKIYNIARKF